MQTQVAKFTGAVWCWRLRSDRGAQCLERKSQALSDPTFYSSVLPPEASQSQKERVVLIFKDNFVFKAKQNKQSNPLALGSDSLGAGMRCGEWFYVGSAAVVTTTAHTATHGTPASLCGHEEGSPLSVSGSQCGRQGQEHGWVILELFTICSLFSTCPSHWLVTVTYLQCGDHRCSHFSRGVILGIKQEILWLTQWQSFSKTRGPIYAPACCGLRDGGNSEGTSQGTAAWRSSRGAQRPLVSWSPFVPSHTCQAVLLRSLSHDIHGDSMAVSKVRGVDHGWGFPRPFLGSTGSKQFL